MYALVNNRIKSSYLDYFRLPHEYRLRVIAIANIFRLTDLYIVPQRQFSIIWNYIREIGIGQTARRVRSRLKEEGRNDKWFSVALCEVLETPALGSHRVGTKVMAVLPCHPQWIERVVLRPELIGPAPEMPYLNGSTAYKVQVVEEHLRRAPYTHESLLGWNEMCGSTFPASHAVEVLQSWGAQMASFEWNNTDHFKYEPSKVQEVTTQCYRRCESTRLSAALFGYGNYAKTNIVPALKAYCSLRRVHEVDPLQMDTSEKGWQWDTSPSLRPGEHFDIVCVAGYHSTHGPLAAEALRRGSHVIVEKPIVTTWDQLQSLIQAMRQGSGGFHSCFQRRYSDINTYVAEDLAHCLGQPISYHCIVYEIPLPASHWYRWPSSRSRLVSNGCHWVDHFLFLNRYAEVADIDVNQSTTGTIQCWVTLQNGATFSMILTDQGSQRIGMQDYTELRCGDTTIKITNMSRYLSERTRKIVRHARINKLNSYHHMYQAILNKISRGEKGDTAESVSASASLVLRLEDRLRETC